MAKRNILIHADENGDFDLEEVLEVINTLVTVSTFIGGQFAGGVLREEYEPGKYQPRAMYLEYNTHVPAQHLSEEPVSTEILMDGDEEDPGEENDEDGAPAASEPEPVTLES